VGKDGAGGGATSASGRPAVARLTPADWAGAALEVMAEGGTSSVAVEPLARRLGATKGSFYWHFSDREALVVAALDLWERLATLEVIEALAPVEDPRERLRRLLAVAFGDDPRQRIDARLLAGSADPLVAPVLQRVTRARGEFITGCLIDLGHDPADAERRSLVLHSTHVGFGQLHLADPGALPRGKALTRWLDELLDLVARPPRP
jgi:AcrR family transcriptional regulator